MTSDASHLSYSLFIFCKLLFECFGKLVGTARLLETASDALETAYDFFGLQTFAKCGNALKVSVASAVKAYVVKSALVVTFERHTARTGAGKRISYFHICLLDRFLLSNYSTFFLLVNHKNTIFSKKVRVHKMFTIIRRKNEKN